MSGLLFFKVLHGQIICISTTLFAHFRYVIWSSFVWFTLSPMQWKTLSLLHRSSFLSVLIIFINLDCVCVFLLSSIVCMFAHTHTKYYGHLHIVGHVSNHSFLTVLDFFQYELIYMFTNQPPCYYRLI